MAGVLVMVEQPASATSASAEPARVRINLLLMMDSFDLDCVGVVQLRDESIALYPNNGPRAPVVYRFSKYSADQVGFGPAE